MRDLTTIAAQERETRTALRDLRLSIQNKRASLANDEAQEAKLLGLLNELETEAGAAFAAAREIGLPTPILDNSDVTGAFAALDDSGVTEAFYAATTPSDQARIFNGAHD